MISLPVGDVVLVLRKCRLSSSEAVRRHLRNLLDPHSVTACPDFTIRPKKHCTLSFVGEHRQDPSQDRPRSARCPCTYTPC